MKLGFQVPPEIIRNIEHETQEICANLIVNNQNLIIDNSSIVYGSPVEKGGRASCTVKYYTDIIFHTHPRTSYSTPSVEDIIKVLKHTKIKTSVIVTNWGVFQIVKMKDTVFNLDNRISEKILECINYINRNTVNPEYLRYRGTEHSFGLNKNLNWNELTENQKKMINEQLEIINIALFNKAKILLNQPYIYVF